MSTNKYTVRQNTCGCHPQTCCCDDWAIFTETGEKFLTLDSKPLADEMAENYNLRSRETETELQAKALKQTDTVELYGMKDGIQVHLGQASMPPRMKAKEIVVSVFGHFDEHDEMDDGDAALCFSYMTELIDYMAKQERTQAAKITELESQVEALRKDAQWQPIDTAPKDGSEIIMSNGKDVSSGSWFSGFDGTCDRDGAPNCDEREACWMDWGAGMQPEPTHWKPLPKPPAIKGEQAA